MLDPYEFRLSERGKRDREAWGSRIAARLRSRYGTLPVRVTFLAGEMYASAVRQFLPDRWRIGQPLAGRGLGKRMRWLNAALGPRPLRGHHLHAVLARAGQDARSRGHPPPRPAPRRHPASSDNQVLAPSPASLVRHRATEHENKVRS